MVSGVSKKAYRQIASKNMYTVGERMILSERRMSCIVAQIKATHIVGAGSVVSRREGSGR